MVYGVNKKLLSIAIPTWNRSQTLFKALELLLPQVNSFTEFIEIVISDNGSTDDTQSVIDNYISKFPTITFILNKNDSNLGFYGNFKKCRELANGEYLWILSDDDHLSDDRTIAIIIDSLNKTKVDSIYLDTDIKQGGKITSVSTIDLLKKYTCLLTLTSCVIFKNDKSNDSYIYTNFPNNSFLGFLYFSASVNLKLGKSLIIEGRYLKKCIAGTSGYNFFNVFINEQIHALDYLLWLGIEKQFIDNYKKHTLKFHIKHRYYLLKAVSKLGDNYLYPPVSEIENLIDTNFNNYKYYWTNIYPIKICPNFVLKYIYMTEQFLKRTLRPYKRKFLINSDNKK